MTDTSTRTASTSTSAAYEIQKITRACEYLHSKGIEVPEVGIVLGSGIGRYIDSLEGMTRIPYSKIPGFAASTAPSHEGALYYGEHLGKRILIMSGRFHYYEGYTMNQVVFPIRVMVMLGVKRLIVTNAAGSINLDFPAGTIMLISDHINLSGTNPLIGPNLSELGPRFPDMTHAYPKKLREEVGNVAREMGILLHEGVYAMMSGPSFETPAEIRFLRTIGADAVGMSTVPEVIVANHGGMEVIGISCLSNAAAGITDNPLTSEEVEEATKAIEETIVKVIDIAVGV